MSQRKIIGELQQDLLRWKNFPPLKLTKAFTRLLDLVSQTQKKLSTSKPDAQAWMGYLQVYSRLLVLIKHDDITPGLKKDVLTYFLAMHNDIKDSAYTQRPSLLNVGDYTFSSSLPSSPTVERKYQQSQLNKCKIYAKNHEWWVQQHRAKSFAFSANTLYFLEQSDLHTLQKWDNNQKVAVQNFKSQLQGFALSKTYLYMTGQNKLSCKKIAKLSSSASISMPNEDVVTTRMKHLYSNGNGMFCSVSGGGTLNFYRDGDKLKTEKYSYSGEVRFVSIAPNGKCAIVVYSDPRGETITKLTLGKSNITNSQPIKNMRFKRISRITWFADSNQLFIHQASSLSACLYYAQLNGLTNGSINKVSFSIPNYQGQVREVYLYPTEKDGYFNSIVKLDSMGVLAIGFTFNVDIHQLAKTDLNPNDPYKRIFYKNFGNSPITECSANTSGTLVAVRSDTKLKLCDFSASDKTKISDIYGVKNNAV